jgi:Domain of unknown function (DUF1707)
MASGSEMRVGDSEREAAAAELREHYASGRLTLDELNDRIDRAFAAKTRGDLDALMRDLPSARPGGAWQPGLPGRPSGSGWGPGGGSGPSDGWTGSGRTGPGTGQGGWGSGQGPWATGAAQARRTVASIVFTCVLICAFVAIGAFGVFGIGTGRPFGIALLVLAFGLLRRLVFGRRRTRGRAPRGRRRWN